MPLIDSRFYPHILDLILDSAPEEAIPTFRHLNRYARDRVDRRIAEHVLYVAERGRLYTREAHIQLSLQTPALAPRVRTLDYLPPRTESNIRPLQLQFPNLGCTRLLYGDFWDLYGTVIDPPALAIQLALSRDSVDEMCVGTVGKTETKRYVAAFPSRLSAVRSQSLRYMGNPGAAQDLVLVFLPELDDVLTGVSDRSLLAPRSLTIESFASAFGDQPEPFGLKRQGVRSLTVVGFERCVEHITDAEEARGAQTWLSENPDVPTRVISLEQWRGEITEHEWDLVASLPDAARDPVLEVPES